MVNFVASFIGIRSVTSTGRIEGEIGNRSQHLKDVVDRAGRQAVTGRYGDDTIEPIVFLRMKFRRTGQRENNIRMDQPSRRD